MKHLKLALLFVVCVALIPLSLARAIVWGLFSMSVRDVMKVLSYPARRRHQQRVAAGEAPTKADGALAKAVEHAQEYAAEREAAGSPITEGQAVLDVVKNMEGAQKHAEALEKAAIEQGLCTSEGKPLPTESKQ